MRKAHLGVCTFCIVPMSSNKCASCKRLLVLEKLVLELQGQVAFLLMENKWLVGELRKYSNENTPSGNIPPYLKPVLQNKVQEALKPEQEAPKSNQRNSRPKEHDTERDIIMERCPCCGGTRITKKRKFYFRRTSHIKLPWIERVLNKIWAYYCLDCKKEVVPKLPDALPGSKFDLNTAVLISVLFTGFNLSDKKISELFSTIFNLNISPASVSNTLQRLKDYLKDDYKRLEDEIQQALFVHRDETGWRKNGQINWLWVASTAQTVFYKITPKRNAKTARCLKLNKNCVGISDALSSYNNTCKEQQKCWAHLARLAKKPKHYFRTKKEKKDYEALVKQVMELFSQAKKDKLALGCSKELQQKYNAELLDLLGQKNRREKRWFGQNASALKQYILKRKKQWFTFLKYAYVDPTNNRAERDLRHLVLKRKISQQNRSTKHMQSYAMQASLYMTSKHRQQSYPQILHDTITNQLTGEI